MKSVKQMARLQISQLESELNEVAEKYGEKVRADIVTELIAFVHGKAVGYGK